MGKRIKYDWLWIIKDNHLSKAFYCYRKAHSNISEKRCARAFVLKSKIFYKWKCYEVGYTAKSQDFLYRLAKVNWIDDDSNDIGKSFNEMSADDFRKWIEGSLR